MDSLYRFVGTWTILILCLIGQSTLKFSNTVETHAETGIAKSKPVNNNSNPLECTEGVPYRVVLAYPGNGVKNHIVNSITFRWFKPGEQPESIRKYHFQLALDSAFQSIAFSDSTYMLDTATTGSGFAYLTTYYWRVRAKNEVGWGDWSETWNFTTIIQSPETPVPVSPANNSTGITQPLIIKWKIALRAETYVLEVSEDSAFSTPLIVDSTLIDTFKVINSLVSPVKYFWRVKARNTGGESDYSQIWNFRTLGPPQTVTLIYPSNNAVNIPVDPTFTWTRATDQENFLGYWFELASDTAAGVIIRDTLVTDTLKAVTGLANNTSFYWRVKAQNETGWGNFTAWSTFKTVKKLIAAPTNLAATAVAVGQVRLEWTDNSDNETGFVIARKTGDSTSLEPLVILDTVSAGATQYLDSLVSDTTLYSYLVAAYNNDTISMPSNYAQVFTLTGIKELFADQLPKRFDLYQNYPNPFNPSTMIRFAIPKEANVKIELFSMQGELITVLMSENMSAGYYETRLEIPNYASGIYLYRLVAQPVDGSESFMNTKKLILVK